MSPSLNRPETLIPPSEFDQDFTKNVISSIGPKANPRLREIMTGLITHLHDFARETNLTVDEFMSGISMINWAGQMSDDRRNEGQLLSDVIGLESLVDEITYKLATLSASTSTVTAPAILGPFWRPDTPWRAHGSTMTFNTPPDGQVVYLFGTVTDATSHAPIPNASVELWQASTNGLYEQQDENQVEHNLRGKYKTNEKGEYALYCLRPTPYPVPGDGPAGKLLDLLDRHHYRPAHIHFLVQAEGYKGLTTQVFDGESKYLDDDSVFAVKEGLTVQFEKREGDKEAGLQLRYDISMAPQK